MLVLSFAGAYLTAESERWRLLHVTLGYTMGGLLAFRVFWGIMGTRYARFSSFVQGPTRVLRYLRSLLSGKPEHHVGHNPAGALAIVVLMLAGVCIVATGWAGYNEIGGEWVSELHEAAANTMLLVVGIHVSGVLVSTVLHRENLVRSMVTGTKQGLTTQGIRYAAWPVAIALLMAVLAFWWLQWQSAPVV
jgi:cytochrome b